MTLTELNTQSARRSFEAAADNYNRNAVLQHEVEARLLERVEYFELEPGRVLDLGCGPGNGSVQLSRQFPDAQICSLDWALPMLQQSDEEGIGRVCADMQKLPLASRSMDLVYSNLAIQWSPDESALFNQVRRVLKPGGLFLFTSFGPDTLHELRTSWAAADEHTHVHQFLDLRDVGDQLVAAGFQDPVMDVDILTLEYPGVWALMRELKAIGAHNAANGRPVGLTGRQSLYRMMEAYEQFRQGDRYPATYEVVYGAAFAPAEGQPIRDGEGEMAMFSVESLLAGRK